MADNARKGPDRYLKIAGLLGQANSAPKSVPRAKAISVAMPIRPRVQGRAWAIMSETWLGK